MMLADPDIGPGMVNAMKEAREAAGISPVEDIRDRFSGTIFRELVELGYFSTDTCVALTISTDGFQAWRRRSFEVWPIIVKILSADPSSRVQVVSQSIVGITPGPGQSVDSESFLHHTAEELDVLAAGVGGVTVAGFSKPEVVQAFVLQFPTDMPAGDKLVNAIGGNGEHPGRFRDFARVLHKRRYYYPPYAPDDPPPSQHPRFDVRGESTPRRTAASVFASVATVKDGRRAGGSKTAMRALVQKKGFKGYSLFICPGLEDQACYPSLKYLWDIGTDLLPYDTMHLFCSTSCRACGGSFPVRTRSWMRTSHASSLTLSVSALGAR